MVLLASLVVCSLAHAVFAQSATLFPVGFNSDEDLQGEIVGTGTAGTTYVLSGTTGDIPFTVTLVEGSTIAAETFAIPALTLTVAAECIIDGTLAVCDEFVQGGQSGETQTVVATFPFEPFAIAVTSGSALPSSSGSSTTSTTTTFSQSTITALSTTSTSSSSTSASTSASQASSASTGIGFSTVSWLFSAAVILLAVL